jgi:signal transduction histidine kinase
MKRTRGGPVLALATGVSLASLSLAAAHVALRRTVPPMVTYLLASASVAALVSGGAFGFALLRTLARLPRDAAREPLARLPITLVRLVVLIGALLSASGLVVAIIRGVPAPAVLASAASVVATLATLGVTASIAAGSAVRPLLGAVDPDLPAPARRHPLATRLGGGAFAMAAAAITPGAALALGADAPPIVVLSTLAWLLALAAITTSLVAVETADEIGGATTRLAAAIATRPAGAPPSPLAAARVGDVRSVEQLVVNLGDKIAQLRLTRGLAVERAREAERLRTQFLANISHDLRSPLHAVLGFSDLLMRGVDGPLAPAQQQSIEKIRQNGTHLLHIIQEVLDLARVDAGRLDLVRTPAIVAELLEQSMDEVRARFPQLALEVSTRLERGLPTLSVDPYRLVQALAYLGTYAVEASTAGTQRKKVRLLLGGHIRPDMRAFELVIGAPDADLDQKERDHLFDGFRGLKGRSGLGLGPHLARRFVELHGGAVGLGPPAPGLRFEITLPL